MMKPKPELLILILMLAPARSHAVELKAETIHAWDAYVFAAKARVEKRAHGQGPFVRVNEQPDLARRVRAGPCRC